MKSVNKIVVCGPRTSGKTTMLHLLDSNCNLVNYNHDKILLLHNKLFADDFEQGYLKDLKRKKSVVIKSKSLKKFI